MATSAVNAFRSLVQSEVTACPGVTIDAAAVDACRAFAVETRLVTATSTVNTVSGTQAYAITPPDAYHEVFGVKSVGLNGTSMLTPFRGDTSLIDVQATGTPGWFWYDATLGLVLYPTPSAAAALTVEAVIRPKLGAAQVDTRFLSVYSDPIGCWMLYALKAVSNQAWTDFPGSKFNYSRYLFGKSLRRNEAAAGGTTNTLRVSTNFF